MQRRSSFKALWVMLSKSFPTTVHVNIWCMQCGKTMHYPSTWEKCKQIIARDFYIMPHL